MDYEYYNAFIHKVTTGKYDVSPLLLNPRAFSNLIEDLAKPFRKKGIDKVAGIESLGFIIGGAVATNLGAGFIPIRKGKKFPRHKEEVVRTTVKDYSNKEMVIEMLKESVNKGEKVLIVDDWIETGAQVNAAILLIEKRGGKIEGISALFTDKNSQTDRLISKYNLKTIGSG